MFTRLRNRITLVFATLIVVSLVLVGAVFALRTFDQLSDSSIQNQRLLDSRIGQAIQDEITQRVDELNLLGDTYNVGQLAVSAQHDLVNTLLVRSQAYQQIIVVDPDGQERVRVSHDTAVTAADLTNDAQDPLFKSTVANGKVTFSGVYLDTQSGEPLLNIALPFYDRRSGQLSSIIVADFRFHIIWDLVASLQAGNAEGLQFFLTNASGLVVAHANPTIVLQNTVFNVPDHDGPAQGLGGVSALVTRQDLTLGGQKFMVVGQEPIDLALRPAVDAVISTGIITLLALLITVGLVALVVRQIVQPIEKLSQTAQSIRDGNLDARANMTRTDEIGVLGQSLDDMTVRLQDLIRNLETRVTERVRDITIAANVSRQITTELNSERLLADVAELTATTFSLYHVSIFLYNEASQILELREGTGTVGRQMVQDAKRFQLADKGLVPQAARNRQASLSNNVKQEESYFQNPLLPDTQSELAVPMLYRGQLIGVLDLQAKTVSRFRDEDIRIITTLAEQIAIAVRNAQLFTEVQSALAEAERANSVKSAFLASMSHELRTPLNAIINFTKFLMKGKMGPVNDQQLETLDKVKTSGVHLLNLINDVLDISKIESGSLNLLVESDVDLAVLISKAISTGQSLLEGKPIELRQDIKSVLPPIVGDKQRILQILYNVVSNACKFTETGTICISAEDRDGQVYIAVKDTGPGIPAKEHAAVFETFKQTETGLRKGSGTGLGMPISKRLAEAHGGDLLLDSESGKGSTFTIILPVHSDKLEPNFA